jgi:choline dehydrogenase-like flavoprotein
MEHPHCTIGLTVPPSKGVFHQTRFYNDVQRVSNTPVIAKLCLSESRMRSHRLLNQVIDLTPKVIPQAEISKYPLIDTAGIHALKEIRKHGLRTPQLKHHLGIAAKDAYNIYRAVYRMHKAWLWKIFIKANVNTYHLLSVSEQVPNPNSRVTLTKEKDQLGMQRIALDWQLTAQDMDSIHQTVKHMDDGFRQIGLGKIFIRIYNTLPNPAIRGGWHHMGTTRMHRHPYKGVVDPDCKIHTMQNLYIAGPSVFPTGGYANPSLTVVALAIRLADHIKHNFQAGEY